MPLLFLFTDSRQQSLQRDQRMSWQWKQKWLHSIFELILFILGKMDEKIDNALWIYAKRHRPARIIHPEISAGNQNIKMRLSDKFVHKYHGAVTLGMRSIPSLYRVPCQQCPRQIRISHSDFAFSIEWTYIHRTLVQIRAEENEKILISYSFLLPHYTFPVEDSSAKTT